MSLASHIAALKDAAAKDPQTSMLEAAMLNVIEELAEQVAALSLELVHHATSGHELPRR
jgi:hypothetical protein